MSKTPPLKDDEYRRARGGDAVLLSISCADCDSQLFTYQKDGHGPLFRCYFDRIVEPETVARLLEELDHQSPGEVPPLTCDQCGALIGEAMRYRDGRLAFLLYQGTFFASTLHESHPAPSILDEISARNGVSRQSLAAAVERARHDLAPTATTYIVHEEGASRELTIRRRGRGPVQTPYGRFIHTAFTVDDVWGRYAALAIGDVTHSDGDPLLVRIDSGCQTGQLFADLTCECWEQLVHALEVIAESGNGILIAISEQEGRGMGLAFKLGTLQLQDELGLDTVDAAAALAGSMEIDARTYSGVVAVLQAMGVPKSRSLVLLSNNPRKATALTENGYTVAELRPLVIEPTPYTRPHLIAKADRLGHVALRRALKAE